MNLASHCTTAEPMSPRFLQEEVSTDDSTWFLQCKSVADVAIASILLVLTLPLLLFLVLLVKLTSPGPAIFKQVRLGRRGEAYHLFKIRSMAHDCERVSGPQWSTAKDPRVTKLGRFLRKSHLDELPQLWNVVRGEMSLVGPRPERPEFVAKLEREIPQYRDRMNVLPGITGLAQIQLPPDEHFDDVRRKVECDLCYIARMGALLDMKILVGTALKVMGFSFAMTRQVLDLPGAPRPNPLDNVAIPADTSSITHLQST